VESWRVFRLPLALAATKTVDYAMHIQKQLSSAVREAFAALTPSDAALLISERGTDYFFGGQLDASKNRWLLGG